MEIDSITQSRGPATVYDEQFVPALFGPFAPRIADVARLEPGQQVLDVACGTGVLALEAARRVAPRGRATGLDPNPEMLAVARRKQARVEWVEGRAEALPFEDESFDAVVSQFGLMFFEDRVAGLREAQRVLRPGGSLAFAVCDSVDRSPGYAVLTQVLERRFGRRIADAFRAPFAIGNPALLAGMAEQAGLGSPQVVERVATVRFPSIEALVSTERACVWTLGGLLDDAQFDRLLEDARVALQPFVAEGGSVAFDMPALCIVSGKSHRAPARAA